MKFFNPSLLCFLLACCAVASPAQVMTPKTNAAVKDQDKTEIIVNDAQSFLDKGDAKSAIDILQKGLGENPQNNLLKFRLGKIFYSQGNYLRAIENLSAAAEKFPVGSAEKKQAEQMLGLSFYITGNLASAIPYLEKILTATPENSEIAYALGVSYIQTRQPEKSREIYAKLFGVPANSASAFLLNGKMLVRQRFEETAEIELGKALQLDAKLPEVRFILGELAIYRAEIDKGISYLQDELKISPAHGMAFYRLGEAYSRQLKWDEAIPPLQKSIWINPFFSGPYIVLGKVYFKKKDFGNAEAMLRRSVQIDPNNFGAHHLLAQVLQQSGKTEEAKTEFALAEKLRGNGEANP